MAPPKTSTRTKQVAGLGRDKGSGVDGFAMMKNNEFTAWLRALAALRDAGFTPESVIDLARSGNAERG
jgi:hypothetical protein